METICLNTDWNVSKSLEWTVSHAVRELLSNCVDDDRNSTVSEISDTVVLRNCIKAGKSGLTKNSFVYRANEEKGNDTTVSGKFGYGLKDAIAILIANGVGYKAFTRVGSFCVNHICVDGKITLTYNPEILATDNFIEQHLYMIPPQDVVNPLKAISHANLLSEVTVAKSQIIYFRPDILSMKTVEVRDTQQKKHVATIYYTKSNPTDEDGIKTDNQQQQRNLTSQIFVHNTLYDITTTSVNTKRFVFYYNLHIDKKRLLNRDRCGIPNGWNNDITNAIKWTENKEVMNILKEIRSHPLRDDIYEIGNQHIVGYINSYVKELAEVEEQAETERLRLKEQEAQIVRDLLAKEAALLADELKLKQSTEADGGARVLKAQALKVESSQYQVNDLKRSLEHNHEAQVSHKKLHVETAAPKATVWIPKNRPSNTPSIDQNNKFNFLTVSSATEKNATENPSHQEYCDMTSNSIDVKHFLSYRAVQKLLKSVHIPTKTIRASQAASDPLVTLNKDSSSVDAYNLTINFCETDLDALLQACYVAISGAPFECFVDKTSVEAIACLAVRTLACVPADIQSSCSDTSSAFTRMSSVKLDRFCPLFVATEWDTKAGGISAYNIQIARGLAMSGVSVFVLVLDKWCSAEEVRDAKNGGVTIVDASRYRDVYTPVMNGVERTVTHVIGHAHITGSVAAQIVTLPQFKHCRLWQFNHVIPTQVDQLKGIGTAVERLAAGEKKDAEITALNTQAAYVWSVGNDMFRHFASKINDTKHSEILLPLNPYFLNSPTEKQVMDHTNIVILFVGRAGNVHYVKGIDIAILACAALQDSPECQHMQIKLVVRGIPLMERPAVTALVPTANRSKLIDFQGFGSPEDVLQDLHQADVFVMPSRCEPFGLVATEAIACGVPTLVSSNSGVAALMRAAKVLDVAALIVETSRYSPEKNTQDEKLAADVTAWTAALKRVVLDKEAFMKAKGVRDSIGKFIESTKPYETFIAQANKELKK